MIKVIETIRKFLWKHSIGQSYMYLGNLALWTGVF